ncbi:hypothetical protein [Streptomyces liliifuscus]|nr:hypothetical protein [Streptomyces liliifuscus]
MDRQRGPYGSVARLLPDVGAVVDWTAIHRVPSTTVTASHRRPD